jgi:hypothetical protein
LAMASPCRQGMRHLPAEEGPSWIRLKVGANR